MTEWACVRAAILGAALLLLGCIAIATEVLSAADALAIGERVWLILLLALVVLGTIFLSLEMTAVLLTPVVVILAEHEFTGIGPLQFAALTAVPALISVILPAIILFLIFRRDLLALEPVAGIRFVSSHC